MHPLLYVMLIAGGALAHYRGYDTRNLPERDEPDNDVDGMEIVECPVCENTSAWQVSNEECPIVRAGKTYKRCKFGAYNNSKCSDRRDCFRGPGEKCTEKHVVDIYGQRCAPGWYCHPTIGRCTGMDYPVDSNLQWYINPNTRPRTAFHDRQTALSLNYPIRVRRQV